MKENKEKKKEPNDYVFIGYSSMSSVSNNDFFVLNSVKIIVRHNSIRE